MIGRYILSLFLSVSLIGCTSSNEDKTTSPVDYVVVDQSFMSYLRSSAILEPGQVVSLPAAVVKNQAGPVVFSVSPDLPQGLALDKSNGSISGILLAGEQSQTRYAVTATTSSGKSSLTSFYITIVKKLSLANPDQVPKISSISSGSVIDLNSYLVGGSGGNIFVKNPETLINKGTGTVTMDGKFTAGSTPGLISFTVTDSAGISVVLTGSIGVPKVTINSQSTVLEGNNLVISFNLSGISSSDVDINYSVIENTGVYTAKSSNIDPASDKITIRAGQSSGTLTIPTKRENVYKADLTFAVQFEISGTNLEWSDTLPVGSVLANNKVTSPYTLQNVVGLPYVGFSVSSTELAIGDGYLPIQINLLDQNGRALTSYRDTTVNLNLYEEFSKMTGYSVAGGPQWTIVIPAGSSSTTFNLPVARLIQSQYAPNGSLSFTISDPRYAIIQGNKYNLNVNVTDPIIIDISSGDTTDYVLSNDQALANWDYKQNILVRIPSNGRLYATDTSIGAFNTGSLDLQNGAKITLINEGRIYGAAGSSGKPQEIPASVSSIANLKIGQTCTNSVNIYLGIPGSDGGPAITAPTPITIKNYGQIKGGGGGGIGGVNSIDTSCGILYIGTNGGTPAGGTKFGMLESAGPTSQIIQTQFSTNGTVGGELGMSGASFSSRAMIGALPTTGSYSIFNANGELQSLSSIADAVSGKPGVAISDINAITGNHNAVIQNMVSTAVILPTQ